MDHRFNIGQAVDLLPIVLRVAAPGPYEIRHLDPAPGNDPDDPRYLIKCDAEKRERIAPESERILSEAGPDWSASLRRQSHNARKLGHDLATSARQAFRNDL